MTFVEFELCELRIYYKYNIINIIHVQVKHYQVEYSWNQNTTLTINVSAPNLKVKLFFNIPLFTLLARLYGPRGLCEELISTVNGRADRTVI